MFKKFTVISLLGLLLFSCEKKQTALTDEEYSKLTDEQKRLPEHAVDGIVVADDRLELTLFASEPMMSNPTNMDIDDRGRVWIAEAYNYRTTLNPRNPTRAEGDRILIMEDTDGDGVADESKVFYQGNDINAALGIAVLGDKVYVSVSPYVYVFTDADRDDVPEKKEILFEGVGGEQHDHGMHSFNFGPDGKLYFNYGNEGKGIHYADGSPILDPLGRPVNSETQPYREGMVFRMNPDGSDVEVLGWNFRNNYEVATDSYGRMWQSDNDDDGNRSTRINYVMDYGNYGFKDEMTGADWRARRINMEDSVYQQHWHLNDPGVVPNLLQTYAGSPTGILVYEGKLLPEEYQNQVIHSDAGPNIVRAYPTVPSGAGFDAKIINLLDGNPRDNWFRPSDVTVAPDGSLFISDWYDPGVGGHAMGDLDKGRIYRLAPKDTDYEVSKPDYTSISSLINLLQSPNRATHFKAFMALVEKGEEAKDALETLYAEGESRMKARAFWVLTKLPNGNDYIKTAASDSDENIRVAALRAYRNNKMSDISFLLEMASDESAQVRREVALAIRYKSSPEVWQKLTEGYESGDRWYLEALGIAAEGFWDDYLPNYLKAVGSGWMESQEAKDIVWRSRASNTAELLGKIILSQPGRNNQPYYRALDFQSPQAKNQTLKSLLANAPEEDQLIILRQISFDPQNPDNQILSLARQTAGSIADDRDFMDIVSKYNLTDQKDRLEKLVYQSDSRQHSQMAANIYASIYGMTAIQASFADTDQANAINSIEKFGTIDNEEMAKALSEIYLDETKPLEIRTAAAEAARGYNSEPYLWELAKADKIPADLLPIVKKILLSSWNGNIRAEANEKFGNDTASSVDLPKLLTQQGDVEKGLLLADNYCLSCHKIGEKGIDFGPGLTEIGDKLSKEGLFNAILNPSEGMGFGYETQLVKMKDGTQFTCIVNSKTENDLVVKLVGTAEQKIYKLADVESVTQLDESLMPKFPLSETELVDLVSYLETLRK
ncbi:putative membrane-bound dehydrogenase domain-containing protein [Algoriphagus locisalis]|uniref:Putative membrane-bound dehydrogenase domain-containing protein n=1 Tax=Algoriphagus locisalis TaxID=305507 RepID=A0A1I7CG91_9BACT|nr:PVC-type heme-binding CxxCH protein [Algoriphagus locisalis]SFT98465.1 putative membrane-bound dehydrogenase domain-containing protein [Algoriphagus locisalis]